MNLRGAYLDRSITTNQRRSKDFSDVDFEFRILFISGCRQKRSLPSARTPQTACQGGARYCAVEALGILRGCAAPRHSLLSILQEPGRSARLLAASPPCREKLVFGALNRIIEANESGQEWKQSHQRPDQGPAFGDCGGSNPSAEGDDA